MNRYGILDNTVAAVESNAHLERLRINGFCILPEILNASELVECRLRLDAVYETQEREFGADKLSAINEDNLARSPLSYDPFFLDVALKRSVVDLAHQAIGGGYVLLHLQNGIINLPNLRHHQSSWHRDLPYQEFVSSKPLAVGALFCIDDFTGETGGTLMLPFSHREEKFPSQSYVAANEVTMEAPAGSVILFDSMLFHRAGYNSSNRVRRGINHVYSIPIIKPQIELSELPHVKARGESDAWAAKILGVDQSVPCSVTAFRERRFRRTEAAVFKKAV
jgi:ectoine hydroxylase-related dioxygenase (phytanoyl-CoA dioxygenase family)